MINPIVKTIELPDGRTITLETGKLAKQADGSVMLRMGNTMLLATVCAAKDAVPGTDFMPLQVEYKEKFAAFGRFPGGFTKREGRASDYEILTCRLVHPKDLIIIYISHSLLILLFLYTLSQITHQSGVLNTKIRKRKLKRSIKNNNTKIINTLTSSKSFYLCYSNFKIM